jgi:hypothetical protein
VTPARAARTRPDGDVAWHTRCSVPPRGVMRTIHALITFVAGLVSCLVSDRAAAQYRVSTEQLIVVTDRTIADAWPGSDENVAISCKLGRPTCEPDATYFNLAPFRSVPSLTACQSGTATLPACYAGAVTVLEHALLDGDVAKLFEAAARTRHIVQRRAAGAPGPEWMGTSGDLLVRFFSDQGVRLDSLGNCVTGSYDTRYRCMAGPSGPRCDVFRAAVDVLDRFNGYRMMFGDSCRTEERSLAIFRHATAPLTLKMMDLNRFDPQLACGPVGVEQLGKYVLAGALRNTTPSSGGDLVAEIDAIRGWAPAGARAAAPTARLMTILAQDAAARKTTSGSLAILDAAVNDDVISLYRTIHAASSIHAIRGSALQAATVNDLFNRVAGAHGADWRDLLTDYFGGWIVDYGQPSSDEALTQFAETQSPCALVSLEEQFDTMHTLLPGIIAQRRRLECEPVEQNQHDRDEDGGWDSGDPTRGFDEPLCEEEALPDELINGDAYNPFPGSGGPRDYLELDCHWVTYWETVEGPRIEETLIPVGNRIVIDSLRETYRKVLDYEYSDDKWYMDHSQDPTTPVTVARAGFHRATCLDEFAAQVGNYGYDEATAVDCGGTPCSTYDLDDYLPYAVAVRLCPTYVADALGVEAGTPADPDDDVDTCITPYEYVYNVGHYLLDLVENGDIDLLEELDTCLRDDDCGVDATGETLATAIADLANEAMLLTMPPAGMFRQQADLASFSPIYVTSGCGDITDPSVPGYGHCTGLDVAAARQDRAFGVLEKGIDLFQTYAAIDADIRPLTPSGIGVNVDLGDAIPDQSELAYDACLGSACADNTATYTRAHTYRRVQDLLKLYQYLDADRFETAWRRLDGFDTSCLVGDDRDGDGTPDLLECDASCTTDCALWNDATARIADTDTTMAAIEETLGLHGAEIAGADLSRFVDAQATFARSLAEQVAGSYHAAASGVDWLGYRAGRWYVDTPDGAVQEIENRLVDLDIAASSWGYETYIDGYVDTLLRKAEFSATVSNLRSTSDGNQASFCAPVGEPTTPAPDGCGVGDEWRSELLPAAPPETELDTYLLVDWVNQAIRDNLCDVHIVLDGTRHSVGLEAIDNPADPYLVFLSDVGLDPSNERCPQLTALDVENLIDRYTGTLVTDGIEPMRAALIEIGLAAQDYRAYLELMAQQNALFEDYENAFGTYSDAGVSTASWVQDGIVCAGAAVTTIFALAASGVIGAAAPSAAVVAGPVAAGWTVGAWTACASRLASDIGEETGLFPQGGVTSAEDLQFELTYMHHQSAQAEQLYTLTQKLESFVLDTVGYQQAVLRYASLVAAFEREQALADDAFDALYDFGTAPWLDPTVMLFEEEELGSLRRDFRDYASLVRELHRLVEYDVGHAIPEGRLYSPVVGSSFYMPRLSEIAIFKSYGESDAAGAHDPELVSSTADGSDVPAENVNLVAMASLLRHLHEEFESTYEIREPGYGWLGTSSVGIDDPTQNRGEHAMLSDSVFYDPSGHVDPQCDDVAGMFDLHDFCRVLHRLDTLQEVALTDGGTCVDANAMIARWDAAGINSDMRRMNLAYLSHMLVGVDASGARIEVFKCTSTGDPSLGEIDVNVNSDLFTGGRNYFTADELGTVATTGGYYHTGTGITVSHYENQHPVVRGVIDRFMTDAARSNLASSSISYLPGHYLFHIDFSGGTGETSDVFDPEEHLLFNEPTPNTTMAEQIESVALACTGGLACADPIEHRAALVLLGTTAYQGDRCELSGHVSADELGAIHPTFSYDGVQPLQERVPYEMDPTVVLNDASWVVVTSAPESNADVDAILETQNAVHHRPLHVNGMILMVAGASESAGTEYAAPWALYYQGTSTTAPPTPRLRLKLKYSYYSTSATVNGEDTNFDGLLECFAPNVAAPLGS